MPPFSWSRYSRTSGARLVGSATTPVRSAPVNDQIFEEYLEQDFVVEVQVDHEIGVLARQLFTNHTPPLRYPADAVHLATALANNLDELHAFDQTNPIPRSGQVNRADGVPLIIREPPAAIVGAQQDLFVPGAAVAAAPAADAEPPAGNPAP